MLVMLRSSLRLAALWAVLSFVSGCVGSSAAGKKIKVPDDPLVQAAPKTVQTSPTIETSKTCEITNIQIEDAEDMVKVKIKGSGQFGEHQFQRRSESEFWLDLVNLAVSGAESLLPVYSDNLALNLEKEQPAGRVRLSGSLKKPFDFYILDTTADELILTLQLQKAAEPAKQSLMAPSHTGVPTTGSEKKSAGKRTENKSVASGTGSRIRLPETGSGMPVEMSKREYSGKPISLDLLDADLKNVLRLLADLSGTNIVIEPDVGGKVTLKVDKVPWDQVLDMVLAMNDLGREYAGNVIRIARLAKLKQEWNQRVEEIKAKQELIEVSKDIGEITTAYLTVNYAQPVEIAAKISENKSEKGKVSVDERSSLVIYTDYPNRIEDARRLLSRLDKRETQVLIEARIVTATADFTRNLGTTWNLAFLHTGGITPTTDIRNFFVNSPQGPFFAMQLAQVIGDTLATVDFKLSAYEETSQVNVIAAPRVLTINHVKAVISQGEQIPYLVRSDYGSSSTQFKDATVELQVIPHITPDQKVRLEIQAKQEEPTAVKYQVGDSSVPGIDTRRITTELLVDDGKVVVIGGVMRNRETESLSATPALHKIPLLGWLFKQQTTTNKRTELLIFISPKIVETTGVPSRG